MKKIAIAFSLFLLFLSPSQAFAEQINSYDVQININSDGTMKVTENILYDFESNDRHGIFRDLPRSTKVADKYRIQKYTIEQVLKNRQNEKYTTSSKGDNFSVKIGDPDKTINGEHRYTIAYKVENGLGTLNEGDELYWNVTGNDWNVPILNASASIQTPSSIATTKATCFTGTTGSSAQNCSISQDKKRFTAPGLGPNEGLTLVTGFPPNTYPKNTLSDQPATALSPLAQTLLFIAGIAFFGILNIIAPLLVWNWYKKTQKTKLGEPTVNFDIPSTTDNRLSPALAGALDTAELEQNDVVATIFDLAIRKHLKIRQETEKKNYVVFEKEEKKYYFEKLPAPSDDALEPHEKILMDRLFKSSDVIDLSTLNTDFYETFQKMEKNVYSQLVQKKLYTSDPKSRKTMLIVFGVIALSFGGIILGPILLYLSRKNTNRTELGNQIDWNIDGLKLFLEKMNRNYTWQANQIAVVEQMIPYAMALGHIDKFMEQLKVIMPEYQPTWYSGATPFYNISPALMSTMNSSFTTNAPSSSSGFSGGSSGGGGGGGGGGSW